MQPFVIACYWFYHDEMKKATDQNGPSFILLLAWASSPGVSDGIPDPK